MTRRYRVVIRHKASGREERGQASTHPYACGPGDIEDCPADIAYKWEMWRRITWRGN